MQKPNRKRIEWVAIVKDKEDNNLTVDQIIKMYNVTEASYIKWAGTFRKEAANAPVTDMDVINLIRRSIEDFDISIKRMDEQAENLLASKADAIAKKVKLVESLEMLTGVKLERTVQTPNKISVQV